MQQVNTEFGRLFEAWKEKPDIPSTSTGYEYDYPGATAKEYTKYVYNEYRWKGRNYKTNRFFYKGFDLSVSIDGRIGGVMYSWTEQAMWHSGVHPDSDNRWRYDEDEAFNYLYIAPESWSRKQ